MNPEPKTKMREIIERQRLDRERSKYIKEQQKKAKWNNFVDAMCGTGIIRKTT